MQISRIILSTGRSKVPFFLFLVNNICKRANGPAAPHGQLPDNVEKKKERRGNEIKGKDKSNVHSWKEETNS